MTQADLDTFLDSLEVKAGVARSVAQGALDTRVELLSQRDTIGRSLENDWILPDPQCLISGQHATVDHREGAYYLVDVSTNGVYVNGEKAPIGKGNPRQMFDGDKLRMGEFKFEVSLLDCEQPPASQDTVIREHVDQVVGEDSLGPGSDVLEEEACRSALFGNAIVKKATEKTNGEMDDKANPFSAPPTAAEVSLTELKKLLDAFMLGLDITRADMSA